MKRLCTWLWAAQCCSYLLRDSLSFIPRRNICTMKKQQIVLGGDSILPSYFLGFSTSHELRIPINQPGFNGKYFFCSFVQKLMNFGNFFWVCLVKESLPFNRNTIQKFWNIVEFVDCHVSCSLWVPGQISLHDLKWKVYNLDSRDRWCF